MAYDEVAEQPVQVETRTVAEEDRIGRNDPCWCGSRQEVQEVPWRLAPADLRDQLKLLADYL